MMSQTPTAFSARWFFSCLTLLFGRQGLLFLRLQFRLWRNSCITTFQQTPFRPITIVVSMAVVFGLVFLGSLDAFSFIKTQKLSLTDQIVGMVLDFLFLSLGVMLVFSTALLLYASLFASPETAFLLSKPITADKVFAYKFHGALAFSSWTFLMLGAPILIAYGLVGEAPWHYYLFLLLFFFGFILLPGSVGAFASLLIVNFVPRRRKTVLFLAAVALLILTLVIAGQLLSTVRHQGLDRETVNQLLNRLSFARSVLAPSHWVANGLRAAARNGPDDLRLTCYYLALVWSNGLLAYMLTAAASSVLYRRGVNRLVTGGSLRRRYGGSWLDQLFTPALLFVNPSTRLLLIKDFRTFRRDPAQWAQVLIFSGLLVLAFFNIGMYSGDSPWIYVNSVSAGNLLLVGLLVTLYNARFIYPLLSLEGRKFWILGLLPIDRAQLLWGKFAFSTTTTLPLAVGLILFSDLMLHMPFLIVVLHSLTMLLLSIGSSGLSVGLGACMADYRETNPSKIVAGFGGTLNQVVGLLFMLLTFALISGPWHLFKALSQTNDFGPVAWLTIGMGVIAGLLLGGLALGLPIRWGIQSLRKSEF